jgi:hypothetical protein
MRERTSDKEQFAGMVTAVKARIRLLRSFDQISHAYQGYTLVLDGTIGGVAQEQLRIAIGPKTQEQWRLETHCYGPRDCPRYRPGTPYRVQGRRPWMVWVDDDVEREQQDAEWLRRRRHEHGLAADDSPGAQVTEDE